MDTAIRQIENSLGVIIPKKVIDALNLQSGVVLTVNVEPGSTIVLRKTSPEALRKNWIEEPMIRKYFPVFEALGNV
jgi:antitoxin component of MazEF toxin-antitoxin module